MKVLKALKVLACLLVLMLSMVGMVTYHTNILINTLSAFGWSGSTIAMSYFVYHS